MSEQGRVLVRVSAERWARHTRAHQAAVRAWLWANGIDPGAVALTADVRVVALSACSSTILREEFVRDLGGRVRLDRGARPPRPLTRLVASRLRVALPGHLDDARDDAPPRVRGCSG